MSVGCFVDYVQEFIVFASIGPCSSSFFILHGR